MPKTIPPPKPFAGEPITLPGIADLCGVHINSLSQWRYRHGVDGMRKAYEEATALAVKTGGPMPLMPDYSRAFPEPDDKIGSFPVWRVARVTAWLDMTNRKYDLEAWREKRDSGGYHRVSTLRSTNTTRKTSATK